MLEREVPVAAPVAAAPVETRDGPSHVTSAPVAVPSRRPATVQRQLSVGSAGDPLETEADRVAGEVLDRLAAQSSDPVAQRVQRGMSTLSAQVAPARRVRRRIGAPPAEVGHEGGDLSHDVSRRIQRARSHGSTMADSVRGPMESAFGADFGGVRIHTGSEATELNRSISAKAFTVGNDIFFSGNSYQPGTRSGQELLAHELTHTVQQGGAQVHRAMLDSKDDWKEASKLARTRRSPALKVIDDAVAAWAAVTTDDQKMPALIGILDAIVAWRASKGADATTNLGGRADTAKRSDFVDSLLDEVIAEVEAIIDRDRAAWEADGAAMSDPTNHDPADYTYLINAVVDYEADGNPVPWYIDALLKDPSTIKNTLVSSSLITDTRNPTWATSGFVLRAPKENIYAAKSSDQGLANTAAMWSRAAMYKELTRVYQANGLATPAAISAGMTPNYLGKVHQQNEVAVMGTHPVTGAQTTVTAIFVVTAPGTTDPRQPIPLYQEVSRTTVGGKLQRTVVPKPGVSAARMAVYEQIVADTGIPMVAIPLGADTDFRAQPGRPVPWAADMVLAGDTAEEF